MDHAGRGQLLHERDVAVVGRRAPQPVQRQRQRLLLVVGQHEIRHVVGHRPEQLVARRPALQLPAALEHVEETLMLTS